jgi:hypothetical protein
MNARPSLQAALQCLWPAAGLLAATPLAAQPPLAAGEIAFRELGAAFVETHCPKDANALSCPLESVIAEHFVVVRLGAFELAFPLDFLGGQRRLEVQQLASAALDLQERWVQRFGREPATLAAVQAEIATLRPWVDSWTKNDLGGLARGPAGDLLDLLEADPAVREASGRFAPMLLAADKMYLAPQYTPCLRLLMCPTRREFMEMVGYIGLSLPARQKDLWNAGIDEWTQFWVDKTVVVALEYAAWGDDPQFNTGLAMNKFDKDGLRQHFVQQAAGALLFTSLNRIDMTLFEKGLAVNLTIELCGRANTIDGEGSISSTGATTAPYERFVPGGNAAGGSLPAISASAFDMIVENHWRKGKGADLFVEPLRDGQKAGSKRAQKDRQNPLWKDETAHFELHSDDGKKLLVSAPFLGQPSRDKPYVDKDFLNDMREFYRSYQSCFLAWLERDGKPEAEASALAFRELLARVAAPGGQTVDAAVEQVYGVPLSSAEPGEALEWRFLAWLAEQR